MDNTQEITLDIKDNHTYQQLYTKQYDYGSSIIFHIVNDGCPFDIEGVTAIFSLKKPDGCFIENNAAIVNGDIKITITEQMTSAYGKAKFSVTLLKDKVSITTITGTMKIDESVIHPEDIESSDEYNIITDILHKVSEANSEIKISEINAKKSEENAKTSETNAINYATQAENYAQQSNTAAAIASNKAEEATTKANEASASATQSQGYATEASISAANAALSAYNAETSAENALASENTASSKATEASASAAQSQEYAIGNTNSSKYYYEQVKNISESITGALRPMGTVTFANLPALSIATEGDMYNISDEFITTSDFKEGAENVIPAGANVYKTSDSYWDVLAGTPVTSVNGQRGNVNITSESIGALSVDGDSAENTVIYTSDDHLTANAWTNVDVLASGEKHSSIFNKVSKMFKNMRYIWKFLGTTDISGIGNGTITGAVNSLNGNLANVNTNIRSIKTWRENEYNTEFPDYPLPFVYGAVLRIYGNAVPGNPNSATDTYYIAVDNHGYFYTGTQTNRVKTITWNQI